MSKELKQLRDVLTKLVSTPEDLKNGWYGIAKTSSSHFRCEYCSAEHFDCVLMVHRPDCPVLEARAVLAQQAPPASGDVDWRAVHRLIESHEAAKQLGFTPGTSNWGAILWRSIAQPVPTASVWRDIASAPKDQSSVLLIVGGEVEIGAYYSSGWHYKKDYKTIQEAPTHWMPLPEAPTSELA